MTDFDEYDMTDFIVPLVIVIILICLLVFPALRPKFEAETYSRLTGKKVTYWDALWCDLKIQDHVK